MKITCIVDNQVLEGAEMRREHGLSFWIETDGGCVLFDTGQTAEVLSHNLKLLNISPKQVKLLALSHAHYDHTGGLNVILENKNHPTIFSVLDLFTPRYKLGKNDEEQFIGIEFSREGLSEMAELRLSDQPAEILPGLWTTGMIANRTEPQGINKNHFIFSQGRRIPDPYLDDMSLVRQTNSGLILICGCCHAGLLNTIDHVKQNFSAPIRAIIGGIHLKPADDATIDYVIRKLKIVAPDTVYYLNHCTGDNAFDKFTNAFPGQVLRFPAGMSLDFNENVKLTSK